jgi:hypothetical protein
VGQDSRGDSPATVGDVSNGIMAPKIKPNANEGFELLIEGIDVGSGLPISRDNLIIKGIRTNSKIISPNWLRENCGTPQQIELFRNQVRGGDENAAIILLSASWFILPPMQGAEIIKQISEMPLAENKYVSYYLGLCFRRGSGVSFNMKKALDLLETSSKKGCTAAGMEYFDSLVWGGVQKKEMYQKWRMEMGNIDTPECLARIGWAEFNGLFGEKNESSGNEKVVNAAMNGSRFANFQLSRWFLERGDLRFAKKYGKAGISNIVVHSHISYGDLMSQEGDYASALNYFYHEGRKMNRSAFERLYFYFKMKRDYPECIKLVFLIGLSIKNELEYSGAGSKEKLENERNRWAKELSSIGKLISNITKREVLQQMSEMWEKHYYYHPDLEAVWRRNVFAEE